MVMCIYHVAQGHVVYWSGNKGRQKEVDDSAIAQKPIIWLYHYGWQSLDPELYPHPHFTLPRASKHFLSLYCASRGLVIPVIPYNAFYPHMLKRAHSLLLQQLNNAARQILCTQKSSHRPEGMEWLKLRLRVLPLKA